MHITPAAVSSFLLVLSSICSTSCAFSSVTPFASVRNGRLKVFSAENGDSSSGDGGDPFDVEAARQRLEALVGGGEPYWEYTMRTVPSSTTHFRSPSYQPSQLPSLEDISLPPAPPLTTIERERRQAEIQLLGRLHDGDKTVEDIFTLWFNEKGPASARILRKAESLTNEGPAHWQEAEDTLKKLIEEHGVYFVEPVNRLATLYYMQGRLEEAETLCKVVLRVKPWHFGALSSIVMVYAALADANKARLWAASRLPSYAPQGVNKRRTAWVDMAVTSATEALELAEDRVHELFGAPDDYTKRQSLLDNNDADAWQ